MDGGDELGGDDSGGGELWGGGCDLVHCRQSKPMLLMPTLQLSSFSSLGILQVTRVAPPHCEFVTSLSPGCRLAMWVQVLPLNGLSSFSLS